MKSGRKTHMNMRQPRSAGSPAGGRSQRWASNAPRLEPRGSHNARSNYDRYLALAQELQAGDIGRGRELLPARRTLFQIDVLGWRSEIRDARIAQWGARRIALQIP
jgi:hypothetical protein